MVRYVFYFNDNDGNAYTGEISNNDYTGQPIELRGKASLSKDWAIDQQLLIKAVNVNLEATIEQPLEDIYNEDDRYWLFTLKKGSSAIFQGYVSTDDMEQSYSSSKWFLNFDCLDHLSYLESFGYYDSAGLPYSGNDTLFNIITKCLDRGFNTNDPKIGLITSHSLEYNSGDIFKEVYLNQDQFYSEDGEADDCSKVLSDILKSLGCFIIQFRLNYIIISLDNYALIRSTLVPYRDYLTNGTLQATLNFGPNDTQDIIGSEINMFTSHHINANQRFIKKKFYNTFRVRHDFDYSEQIIDDLSTWTLTAEASFNSPGIDLNPKELVSQIALAATAPSFAIKENDVLTITVEATYTDDPTEQSFELRLTNTASTNDYVFRFEQLIQEEENFAFGDWVQLPVSGQDKIEFKPVEGPNTHEITLPPVPEDGDLTFYAYTGIFGNALTGSSNTYLESVTIKSQERPIEATEHTYRRTDKTTGAIVDTYDVRFNTSDRSILKNIFLDSLGNPIPTFQKVSTGTNVVMADYLALMFLQLFSENHIEWAGGVKNNFDFNPKKINNNADVAFVVQEQKDYTNNISSTTLLEVQNATLLSEKYTNETTRIFRESVKPVIKS